MSRREISKAVGNTIIGIITGIGIMSFAYSLFFL